MKLLLYKTQDADNVINKTLTDELELTIKLQGDVDTKNPVIALTRREFDFNYCHIPELGRYYFIRKVDKGAVLSLTCECDYLETHKDVILLTEASYRRSIKPGDYGNVDLELTGRENYDIHYSDVELEQGSGAILSVILGELEE